MTLLSFLLCIDEWRLVWSHVVVDSSTILFIADDCCFYDDDDDDDDDISFLLYDMHDQPR